jgi:glycosyltransferase domain-containing protein
MGAGAVAGAPAPDVILASDITPAQAFAHLKDLLVNASRRPRRAIEAAVLGARRQALPGGDTGEERSAARDKYTLVIPTYNRSGQLLRLLQYLKRERADFPIVVLDSSEPEAFSSNQAKVAALSLGVRHLQYDPATDPYVKIREGLRNVATPYCSVCADDDILFVPGVRQCVTQLDRRPDAAVSHGWYFNFIEQGTFDLSYVMYRGTSIDDPQPLSRLRALFAAYEALFYGVFRTEVASRAYRDVDKVGTVLGKELVTGAIAAISGKALRLPCIYYGRNTADSLPYSAWHPQQILAYEPELLFAQFPAFRKLLLEALRDLEPGFDPANAAKSIDLIFLRYLAPFLRHDMLDLMLDMSMRGEESATIYRKAWDVFVRMPRGGRPAEPLVDSAGRYSPKRLGSARPRDYVATRPAWDGKQRNYRVFYDFIYPHMQPSALIDRETLVSLLRTLDAY